MLLRRLSILALCCATVSCSPYKATFDCAPPTGVGCKSVSQIEASIIEREEGANLFLLRGSPSDCKGCKKSEKKQSVKHVAERPVSGSVRVERIWFSESKSPAGNQVEGHYVYFPIIEEPADLPDLKSIYKMGAL
jgi:hypothetical protein